MPRLLKTICKCGHGGPTSLLGKWPCPIQLRQAFTVDMRSMSSDFRFYSQRRISRSVQRDNLRLDRPLRAQETQTVLVQCSSRLHPFARWMPMKSTGGVIGIWVVASVYCKRAGHVSLTIFSSAKSNQDMYSKILL